MTMIDNLYPCGMNLDNILSNPIQDMQNIYEWFVYNSMMENPVKFQFIVLGSTGSHTLQIGHITMKLVSSTALLCITVDPKLNFKEHVDNIVKKHIKL